jgi:ubiquinone/menaquinone biosynthesis C-methylase UbiE
MKPKKNAKCRGGNLYDKYSSRNPVVKFLMNKFFNDINIFLDSITIYSVLDVGCGEGYITNHIKKHKTNIKIEALDFSREILQIASIMHPEIRFSQGSIYRLPFKDNTFDLVVANEVLEHLEYPEKAIEEIKRVSRKYCLITVPNEPFFRMANMLRLKYLSSFGNTPGHLKNLTQHDFKQLLNNNFRTFSIKLSTLWQIAFCEI